MGGTYQCAMCERTFESERSEEEALAEKQELWGDVPIEDCDVVCDDCWQEVRPDKNEEEYERYKASLN